MPRKNITSDEPQVPKATSKRTLTPEQLANLARARQKAQELRAKAKQEREENAAKSQVEQEITKKIKKKKEPEPEPEPELQEEEYLEPEVQPPKEPNPPPPKTEVVESANPLAKTIKQKKKIIFEDSGDESDTSEPIIVVRKKKEKVPEKVPEPVQQPVFYREAPMRPINPFQRYNDDIYRR